MFTVSLGVKHFLMWQSFNMDNNSNHSDNQATPINKYDYLMTLFDIIITNGSNSETHGILEQLTTKVRPWY